MSENSMGVKCLALNVRATNVWKSKWALNVRRQMSENSHWRQMSLGVKCHMPISRQMSLASIVTTSNRHQRSGLKSLGNKRPRRQTAWIRGNRNSFPKTVRLCLTWVRLVRFFFWGGGLWWLAGWRNCDYHWFLKRGSFRDF